MNLNEAKKIISDALIRKGLYSEAVENLMLGTMAVESDFGNVARQVGGPALGIFQMEQTTFDWLKTKYSEEYGLSRYAFEDIEHDHKAAALFARLRYLVVKKQLPPATDLPALAKYWKQYYNTPLGKGKISDFIEKYNKYVFFAKGIAFNEG